MTSRMAPTSEVFRQDASSEGRKLTDFNRCLVDPDATLLDGLRAIDRGGVEIALVIRPNRTLAGVLTDGDARRAILSGASLDSPLRPHARPDFVFVRASTSRAEVLDLMQARMIGQVPILDENGLLVGLHRLHEILGAVERPNWAVVMAGGQGTRLRPLTDHVPKPMLRVAGRPILERIVLHLVGFGIRRIFLSVNYLGQVIEEHFDDGRDFGCTIEYLREAEPLGTGGALALLPAAPTLPFIVMNGDLVTQVDIGRMLDVHDASGSFATVGAREYVHTVPFGCLTRKGDRITAMVEKPSLRQSVNAGIYVLDPGLLALAPKDKATDLPSMLTLAIESGQTVTAFDIDDDWIDVGKRDELERARGVTVT